MWPGAGSPSSHSAESIERRQKIRSVHGNTGSAEAIVAGVSILPVQFRRGSRQVGEDQNMVNNLAVARPQIDGAQECILREPGFGKNETTISIGNIRRWSVWLRDGQHNIG